MHDNDISSGLVGCVYVDGKIYVGDADNILVYNKDLKLLAKKAVGSSNHGLDYCEESDSIYLVSSAEGVIYKLDRQNLSIKEKIKHLDAQPPTSFYINNVCVIKKDLLAITVHNREHEGYVTLCYKGKEIFPIIRGLNQPHDFKVINKYCGPGFVVNDSKNSSVICHKTPIEDGWEQLLQDYTRGMCILNDKVYVCTSTNHSRIRHDKISDTINNVVFKLDLLTGEVLDQFTLNENTGQEIFAITCIED